MSTFRHNPLWRRSCRSNRLLGLAFQIERKLSGVRAFARVWDRLLPDTERDRNCSAGVVGQVRGDISEPATQRREPKPLKLATNLGPVRGSLACVDERSAEVITRPEVRINHVQP